MILSRLKTIIQNPSFAENKKEKKERKSKSNEKKISNKIGRNENNSKIYMIIYESRLNFINPKNLLEYKLLYKIK